MKKIVSLTIFLFSGFNLFSAQFVQRVARLSQAAVKTLENTRGFQRTALYPNQDRYLLNVFSQNQILMGIFDGHGKDGDRVSSFVQEKALDFFTPPFSAHNSFPVFYHKIQEELKNQLFAHKSGTTACMALLVNDNLVVSHVGDSRLLIVRDSCVVFATQDHKPSLPLEYKKIVKAGGVVIQNRVINPVDNSSLALSRSLGDCAFGTVISQKPELSQIKVLPKDIIVMATDGLFDVMSNQQVSKFINEELSYGNNLEHVAQALTEEARARSSDDDITVQLITFD